MVEKKYEKIIILEDDARFEGDFKSILTYMINEMKEKSIKWELLYLGRKIMKANVETWNFDVEFRNGYGIRNPDFSHWTVAYALTLDGAKKLLNQEPLKKIVPIDEYFPIMYDKVNLIKKNF
jgi:collagen beta-1,O-galactosyltransferase